MVSTVLSKSTRLSSNLSGATNFKYMEEKIKCVLESNAQFVDDLYKLIKELGMLNEQCVLDWLDRLNEISVR